MAKIFSNLHMLETTGKLLYGKRWQSALADELDIDPRTIRRFVRRTHEVNEGIASNCVKLLNKRRDEIEQTCKSFNSEIVYRLKERNRKLI